MEDPKSDLKEPLVPKQKAMIPFYAWIVFVISILGGASIGPFMDALKGITPFLKVNWRAQVLLIELIPALLIEIYYMRDQYKKDLILDRHMLYCIGMTIITGGLRWALVVYALDYTTVAQAWLFVTSNSLLIGFWRLFRGYKITKMEILGTFLGFLGLVLCTFDPTRSQDDIKAGVTRFQQIFQGNLVSLLACACSAAYYIFNRQLRQARYPFMLNQFMRKIGYIIFYSILTFSFEPTHVGMSDDNSLFGWIQGKWFSYMLILGIVTGYFGIFAPLLALTWIDELIVTVGSLSEPLIGGVISFLVGLEPFPGVMTWIGGVFTFGGIFLVIKYNTES